MMGKRVGEDSHQRLNVAFNCHLFVALIISSISCPRIPISLSFPPAVSFHLPL